MTGSFIRIGIKPWVQNNPVLAFDVAALLKSSDKLMDLVTLSKALLLQAECKILVASFGIVVVYLCGNLGAKELMVEKYSEFFMSLFLFLFMFANQILTDINIYMCYIFICRQLMSREEHIARLQSQLREVMSEATNKEAELRRLNSELQSSEDERKRLGDVVRGGQRRRLGDVRGRQKIKRCKRWTEKEVRKYGKRWVEKESRRCNKRWIEKEIRNCTKRWT